MSDTYVLEGRIARLEVANARLCAQVNETADALAACGHHCKELESLICDMFADFVESCPDEGPAYWPREQFGERLVKLGVNVPIQKTEQYEIEYQAEHNDTRFRDLLVKLGVIG